MAIDMEVLHQAKRDHTPGRFVLDDGMEVRVKRIASLTDHHVVASVTTGEGTGVLRRFILAEISHWIEEARTTH